MDCKKCLLREILDLPNNGNIAITKHASVDKPSQDGAGIVVNVYITRNYSVINKTAIPDDVDAAVDDTAKRCKNLTVYGDVSHEPV